MSTRHLLIPAFFVLLFLSVPGCTVTYVDPPARVHVVDDGYYEDEPEPLPPSSMDFYELGEYGEWIDIHPFGTVWHPRVVHDWRPFTYGHWAWTEWGWTWISYEPFGWAVYHYGNWHYDPMWGWIWIPGYDWEPVRVQWVWYDDYVCWTPLPPRGYYVPDPWSVHSDVWIVVHARHFANHDLHRFRVKHQRYKHGYKERVKVYRNAPRVDVIEHHTRSTIPRVRLDTKSHKSGTRTYKKIVLPAGEKKVVDQYKPRVRKSTTKSVRKKATDTKGSTDRSVGSTDRRDSNTKQPAKKSDTKTKTNTKKKKKSSSSNTRSGTGAKKKKG